KQIAGLGQITLSPKFYKGATQEQDFLQNFAHYLVTNKSVNPEAIGIVVPANHGLPGGGTSYIPQPRVGFIPHVIYNFPLNAREIGTDPNHGAEESVMSNWYVHHTQGLPNDTRTKENMTRLYQSTIQGAWGLRTN
ncbi:unnamed protein product, partial [Amoebophrya sp. A25]